MKIYKLHNGENDAFILIICSVEVQYILHSSSMGQMGMHGH